MLLEPLPPDRELPAPLLAELTGLFASNRAFHRISGDFPDPDDVRPDQVAAVLAEELATPGAEALTARTAAGERLVGIAVTLARHPDPADPDPWIGLLMVHADAQGRGHGRALATAVEERFRAQGRTAVRLAVLAANPRALAFWTALGYAHLADRTDCTHGRPCAVLRKALHP
ncbi:GNAT family N-acetyltransferase [Streptomyces sp. NPDC088560]|uniref:GNAT family N-acetyltransferase n=1 Tax=Streptomyces sp. NPDC088560 TaxID=3365868 RepID=UPI0037F2248F